MIRLGRTTALMALLAASALYAHDPRLHGDNASTGEVTAVTKDSFDLKTKTGVVHVKYSNATKFEMDGKTVAKNPVRQGQRVGVLGAKASDAVTAEQIIVLPATNAPAEKKVH